MHACPWLFPSLWRQSPGSLPTFLPHSHGRNSTRPCMNSGTNGPSGNPALSAASGEFNKAVAKGKTWRRLLPGRGLAGPQFCGVCPQVATPTPMTHTRSSAALAVTIPAWITARSRPGFSGSAAHTGWPPARPCWSGTCSGTGNACRIPRRQHPTDPARSGHPTHSAIQPSRGKLPGATGSVQMPAIDCRPRTTDSHSLCRPNRRGMQMRGKGLVCKRRRRILGRLSPSGAVPLWSVLLVLVLDLTLGALLVDPRSPADVPRVHHQAKKSGHEPQAAWARQRTTRTGRSETWITLWTVLPSTRAVRSLRPLEPITMTPASWARAAATIWYAAWP
jgi:hypothetical protein